jgi:predicted Zn-dependent protease
LYSARCFQEVCGLCGTEFRSEMHTAERISQLRQLLKEDPDDPFLHYALCLELKKAGSAEADARFETILERFPEYLPAYYQTALFMAETGQLDKAAKIAQFGILLAQSMNELHTLSELKGLVQNIRTGEFD